MLHTSLMQERRDAAWTPIATAVALCLCVYTFYCNSLCVLYGSYDTGWIVRTGQFILEHGLPQQTMFSWAVDGQPYVAYQWLFAVLSAKLFEAGSLWLVGFVACVASAILIFLVLPRIWTAKDIPLWMPLLTVAAVQTPHWFNARPQMCSYFLLLAFLSILEEYRRSNKVKWLFALPPLMVLWVNLHAFWIFGLFAIAIYVVADAIRPAPTQSLKKAFIQRSLGACAIALCPVAVAMNPYGMGLLSYIATFFDGSQYNKIYELQPWITSGEYWWTLLYVPFVVFMFAKNRKSIPIEGMIISAITCIAALCMRRLEPVFVIASWPFLGVALSEMIKQPIVRRRKRLEYGYAALALAVPIFSWYSHCPTMPAAWMVYTEDTYPLLKLVQDHTANTRVFCPPMMRSWLLAMDSTQPVFVDSRFDAYPKRFLKVVDECLDASPKTLHRLNQLGIEHVVVRDDMPLAHLLISSPDWYLALDDGMASWWIRESQSAKLDEWQLNKDTLPPHIAAATAELRDVRDKHLRRIYAQLAGNDRNQIR
jgi:hypothetical protein